jgi:CelD/BcsL family acetyltransferase involved in cellulose biosynthesis
VSTPLRVERVDDLDALAGAWQDLAEAAGNVFSTWEWAATWWRHLGHGRLVLLALRDPDGRTVGIVPLHRVARGPLRTLRFLGHGPADRLGPVCAPADRGRVAAALRGAVEELGADLWIGERTGVDEGWGPALGARVLRREASPVVLLGDAGWEEFLARHSSNFRQQVRRRERKLQRERGARIRLADDPARLGRDLGALFALHRARWAGESTGFADRHRAFHAEFAATALERGWLRLWLAEADGAPIAAWYGFRFGGAEWFYQAGRDPDDRWSTGFVLMAHAIREALRDGQREFRLLLGAEPYKERFADADAPVDTLVIPRGPLGQAAVGAAGLAARSVRGRHVLGRLTS